MATRTLRIAMDGVTGRLGTNQHLIRSVLAIRQEGGLALKNGDRLETINGFPLGSPETALQAYARLSTAQHLDVRLTRAGRPLDIAVSIN